MDIEKDLKGAETAAVGAARSVGTLMRRHLAESKRAHSVTQHDIKLDLDVRSQKLIERTLRSAFPDVSLLGEEGSAGKQDADFRWVVDPIDGTVNFAYGIPHACVSIALQGRTTRKAASVYEDGYQTLVGVVYDPFCDEMWTALAGQHARLNGRSIRVSQHNKLAESIISIGFAKTRKTLEHTLPYFNQLVRRVRKVRIMGSAALALTYVATGRFDAYIERGIRLWDIAAGGLIVERAGGEFWRKALGTDHKYRMIASNGRLRRTLRVRD
jgi:myo-inositol-1(or 4)-monophosphatase